MLAACETTPIYILQDFLCLLFIAKRESGYTVLLRIKRRSYHKNVDIKIARRKLGEGSMMG